MLCDKIACSMTSKKKGSIMFKKLIYSCMALSLTLLPASEVLGADIGGSTYTTGSVTVDGTTNTWETGKVTNNGAEITVQGYNVKSGTESTPTKPNYEQTAGSLTLKANSSGKASTMTLIGDDGVANYAVISGGSVKIGDGTTGNTLTIARGGQITQAANINLGTGNLIHMTGDVGDYPSLVIDSGDTWNGTIRNTGDGIFRLVGYQNSVLDEDSVFQQENGRLELVAGTNNSKLWLNNSSSYISAGTVIIYPGSSLYITEDSVSEIVTLGEDASVEIGYGTTTEGDPNPGNLYVIGNGTAILNDIGNSDPSDDDDVWNGQVILGSGYDESGAALDSPELTLQNVTKDFTDATETASFYQKNGTLNISYNTNGGSNISDYSHYLDEDDNPVLSYNGTVNIEGLDEDNTSSLNIQYLDDVDAIDLMHQQINLLGDAEYTFNTEYENDDKTVTTVDVSTFRAPTGTGANNTVTKSGRGSYSVGAYDDEGNKNNLKMGYNLNVRAGDMLVDAKTLKIGIDDEVGVTPYGDLTIGGQGLGRTNFYTTASSNTIVGGLAMQDGWFHQLTPATTYIGGDMVSLDNSGINMMNGKIDSINIAGTNYVGAYLTDPSTGNEVNNTGILNISIDIDPQKYLTIYPSNDTINSSAVVGTPGSVLNLTDYNLLSSPTRDKYTFRVVNAANENYSVNGTAKTVTGNATRILHTYLGDYAMVPSATKGAFDLALFQHNPQIFRPQVAMNVIYANQNVINNQLFDRMIYSNLPYFNGRCTNKTAAADTLYSPYQYTTQDTGLWFKPYANFETIHMSNGLGKVRNNAYGAMIGADFGRKDFGSWSFIPSAFIGYNGGRTTFNGVGMWHNGGQLGFMGTLTNRDFVSSLAVYAGGYHNAMDVLGKHDQNGLWNVGVASKTAYNIHLPADFILQPSLYMAYNYVGASKFRSKVDDYYYKPGALNAYSIAPGVTLIWQKETFSIYALFQAMFNINAVAAGRVAELELPHVGIKDPYFEYGVGATKYFKERFSGYGQLTGRSGSRKGIGFQLGLNLKI